jgi:hypothetical protein
VTCDEKLQTLTLLRWHNEQKACCVLNFSSTAQPIKLAEDGNWKMILNSADSRWDGPDISETEIQPQSIIIYSN